MQITGNVVCLRHNWKGKIHEHCVACQENLPSTDVLEWMNWLSNEDNKKK